MKNNTLITLFFFITFNYSCNNEKGNSIGIDNSQIIENYLDTLYSLEHNYLSMSEGINFIINSYNKGNNLMYNDSSYPSIIYFGYYTISKYGLLYRNTGNKYCDEIVKLMNENMFGKGFHKKVEMEWDKFNKPYLGDGLYHDGYYGYAGNEPSIEGMTIREYIRKEIIIDKNNSVGSAYFSVTKEGRISVLIDEKTGSYIDTLLVNLINNVEACKPAEINEKKVDYRIWLYYNL